MQESFEMLGFKGNISDLGIIQPKQKSGKGRKFTREEVMTQRRYFELDIGLYEYAVDLHKKRYAAFKRGDKPVLPAIDIQ